MGVRRPPDEGGGAYERDDSRVLLFEVEKVTNPIEEAQPGSMTTQTDHRCVSNS